MNTHQVPTVYATLVEESVQPSVDHFAEELRLRGSHLFEGAVEQVKEVATAAYKEGVRHGFQQGVEAETRRRDAASVTHP
jgi:flagellar biosynthesis/type III secretory pathway protein FliH